MDSGENVVIRNCPQVVIESLPQVKTLSLDKCEEIHLNYGYNLPNVRSLSITGNKKPSRWSQDIGSTLYIAHGTLGDSSTEVTLQKTKITQIPAKIQLESLVIDSSFFANPTNKKVFPAIASSDIKYLQINNSEIMSIFMLGLSKYEKPFTFTNNKIRSTCPPTKDKSCFLNPHETSSYKNITVQCVCSEKEPCSTFDKGVAVNKNVILNSIFQPSHILNVRKKCRRIPFVTTYKTRTYQWLTL